MPRRETRPLVLTPRRPSSPALQRFFLTIASIPVLPPLSWRVVRGNRSALRQAMRVVRSVACDRREYTRSERPQEPLPWTCSGITAA
jgi:hypothetical protein